MKLNRSVIAILVVFAFAFGFSISSAWAENSLPNGIYATLEVVNEFEEKSGLVSLIAKVTNETSFPIVLDEKTFVFGQLCGAEICIKEPFPDIPVVYRRVKVYPFSTTIVARGQGAPGDIIRSKMLDFSAKTRNYCPDPDNNSTCISETELRAEAYLSDYNYRSDLNAISDQVAKLQSTSDNINSNVVATQNLAETIKSGVLKLFFQSTNMEGHLSRQDKSMKEMYDQMYKVVKEIWYAVTAKPQPQPILTKTAQ